MSPMQSQAEIKGRPAALGEKVAMWLIVAIIIYLVIAG